MKTAALFAFFLATACAARAEPQVVADDCRAALSRMAMASKVELYCLSEDDIARVVDELVRTGVIRRAGDAGIETPVIANLAARLRPVQTRDLAQAAAEISYAAGIAIGIVAEAGNPNGSGDQLTGEVLKRIAGRLKANDAAGATRAAEEGFTRFERLDQEPGGKDLARGVALLEAALNTDLLRFDAASAAGRAEKIVSVQYPHDPNAAFAALRERRLRFYMDGRGKGINFPLEVAIAISRREVALAQGPEPHGIALSDLGVALECLGEREGGTEKLEEAALVFREALKELSLERAPADRAQTQNNLGVALALLGERENNKGKLEEAVRNYREALKQLPRERAPLDWAQTQFNLGNALLSLEERESGRKKLEEAILAYHEALKERSPERAPLDFAQTEMNLGMALWRLGTREKSTETLFKAVQAYRESLQGYTRERAPYQWATAQNNLGIALSSLGEHESGTEKLEEAGIAFREALKERTRERLPPNWAFTQMNLAMVYCALFDKDRKIGHLNDALEAVEGALEEFRKANAAFYVSEAERQRKKILAIDPASATGSDFSDFHPVKP
jgi:tetratricopeptide (TPR) repeat protein